MVSNGRISKSASGKHRGNTGETRAEALLTKPIDFATLRNEIDVLAPFILPHALPCLRGVAGSQEEYAEGLAQIQVPQRFSRPTRPRALPTTVLCTQGLKNP
jgi:hypothetical protein